MDGIGDNTTITTGERQCTRPHLAITCLGALTMTCDGQPLSAWPNQKARELLAYLATCDGGQASRKAVQAALWPHVTEPWATQGLLRTALWNARQLVDRHSRVAPRDTARAVHSIIVNEGNLLLLNPLRCTSDYAEFCADRATLLRSEASAVAVSEDAPDGSNANALARRWLAFADTCACPICAGEFFPWLDDLTTRQRAWRLDALAHARRFAERAGELALVAQVLDYRLHIEPLHEPTLASLLRVRLALGETAKVVTRYRTFRQELARNAAGSDGIILAPSAEVEALYLAALGKTSSAPAATTTGAPIDIRNQHHQTVPLADSTLSEYALHARPPPGDM